MGVFETIGMIMLLILMGFGALFVLIFGVILIIAFIKDCL